MVVLSTNNICSGWKIKKIIFQYALLSEGLPALSKLSEYDEEIPQSHTADQPTAPWGRATELYICKTILEMITKLETTLSSALQFKEQIQKLPHQQQQQNNRLRTDNSHSHECVCGGGGGGLIYINWLNLQKPRLHNGFNDREELKQHLFKTLHPQECGKALHMLL